MAILSFDEAISIVSAVVRPLRRLKTVPVAFAAGMVLREDVTASDAYPRFDNSSVDGYAIGSGQDAAVGTRLRVTATIGAGLSVDLSISAGTAVQVFTGARVPDGTYGVVMQEDVVLSSEDGYSVLLKDAVREGENIRREGYEVQTGDLLLRTGTRLNSGTVALAALAGKAELLVTDEPRVAIVSTGDELVDVGQTPVGAQIRDTSSPMLQAMVGAFGVNCTVCERVPDDPEALEDALLRLSTSCDLLVLTGGVSVGNRDYLPSTLSRIGDTHFHGVAMRPGKPLLFGTIGSAYLFGLPGNPASSYVAAQTFVRESIRLLSGERCESLPWIEALVSEAHAPVGREDFLRVKLAWRGGRLWADPRFEQASFGLKSLAMCDGIARMDAGRAVLPGEVCQVLVCL